MAKTFRLQHVSGVIAGPIDAKGNVIYSEEEVKRINEEYNRHRINGNEMEQMIGLVSAGNLFRQCLAELMKHAEHAGQVRFAKQVSTMVKTLAVRLASAVECRQMGAIMAQTHGAKITVAATPNPAYINIEMESLLHICNRAMEYCDFCCTCTRDQSKDCALRKALDLVPGVKEQGKEYARKDATRCPYRGMEMEVDGDA